MCARKRAGRRPARSTRAVNERTLRDPESASRGPAEAFPPVRRSAPTRAAELCARSRRTSSPARSFGRGLLLLLRLGRHRLGLGLVWLDLDLGLRFGLDGGRGLSRRLLDGIGLLDRLHVAGVGLVAVGLRGLDD